MDRGSSKHGPRLDDEMAKEVEERSRLGRYLPMSALPGERDTLRRVAAERQAPDDILEELAALPAGRQFRTGSEVWAALGRPNESHRW